MKKGAKWRTVVEGGNGNGKNNNKEKGGKGKEDGDDA